MEFKDYYATLGLDKKATDKEIKQAYRRLARKLHPDVNPGDARAEARFKELTEAHNVLGDPEKRRKYDELGANWRQYEQAQAAGVDPFGGRAPGGGHWSVHMGGPGGARSMTEEEMRELFGGGDPFSDFFQTFFGGQQAAGARSGRERSRSRRGRDVEHDLTLTLEEAFGGVSKRLALTRGGDTRHVEVRIPAGVRDGARVRVGGEGERGPAGAGDLYLRVHVAPHPVFERKGHDLHVSVAVSAPTAVLGGQVDVPTPEGRAIKLRVPSGTQGGQVFRLRAHGMPRGTAGADRGDLYATVSVRLPRQPSDEQRRHYEALAKLETAAGRETTGSRS